MTALAYRVQAYNALHSAENKIHDDEVARRFGFRGALVAGADVYAHMAHIPFERWGAAWLGRGTAECRFLKPVYDGAQIEVSAEESEAGLELKVVSGGDLCATGHARLPPPASPCSIEIPALLPPQAQRRPADAQSLSIGTRLGTRPLRLTPDFASGYLHEVRESDSRYAEDKVGHPGLLLRLCNSALKENVVLGPWIHVGSTVQHLAAMRIGDELTAQATVTGNYERKGHEFVELDVVIVADGTRPIAWVHHTAIYRPRQVAAA